jgi:HEPN domain-containing protein
VDRRDLQKLSVIRLREAKALANVRLNDGAYYLAGYSVECALKACIAKGARRHEFPDRKKTEASYTHNLNDLLGAAKLEKARNEEAARDSAFRDIWGLVQWWSEQSRYSTNPAEKARALIEAVGDRNHGVLQWIRRYW